MSRFRTLALLLIVAVSVGWMAVSAAVGTESDDVIAQLLQRIEALEARVAVLEQANTLRVTPVPHVVAPPTLPGVPEHWQKREFNGSYYYIVPLGDDPAKAGSKR